MNFNRLIAIAGLAAAMASGAAAQDITGKVTYTGAVPAAKKIKMDADPVCAKANADPMTQDVVMGPGNTLGNVLIYVKAGLAASATYPTPAEPVKVDQKGCVYEPRVAVAMLNQPIQFSNSDPTKHHVQAMAESNPEWVTSQDPGTSPQGTKFSKVEIGMLVICHLHPWMRMFVHVLPNPYYAVTKADGSFTLKGLPPGDYTVEAWHERFGTISMKVKAGGKANFEFTE
jgi:plastocyanin